MSVLNQDAALGLAKKTLKLVNNLQEQLNTVLKQNMDVIPSENDKWDIGTDTLRYKDLYLSGNADIRGGLTVEGTLQPVNLFTTKNEANSIYLYTNGGESETINIKCEQGTNSDSINIRSEKGGINIQCEEDSNSESINMHSENGGIRISCDRKIRLIADNDLDGGFDIDAGEDGIDIDTAGPFNVETTGNDYESIYLYTNGGTSETIKLYNNQGNNAESINIYSNVGGVKIYSGHESSNAIYLHAGSSSNNTIKLYNELSTKVDSINLYSNAGGINLYSGLDSTNAIKMTTSGGNSSTIVLNNQTGNAEESINIESNNGGINIKGGLGTIDAVHINTTNSAGGINLDAGTSGIEMDSTGIISIQTTKNIVDAIYVNTTGGATETIKVHSNLGTSTNSINIVSDVGGININGGLGTIDAIHINASNISGGINLDAGNTGITIDTTGLIDLESSKDNLGILLHAAGGTSEAIKIWSDFGNSSNSIYILSDIGGINITGGQNTGNAIQINASNTTGGIIMDAGSAGIEVDTTGSIDLQSNKNGTEAIYIHTNGGSTETIKIHSDLGTSSNSINIVSDSGGINIKSNTLLTLESIKVLLNGIVDIQNTNISYTNGIATGLVLSKNIFNSPSNANNINLKGVTTTQVTTYLIVRINNTPYYIPLIDGGAF